VTGVQTCALPICTVKTSYMYFPILAYLMEFVLYFVVRLSMVLPKFVYVNVNVNIAISEMPGGLKSVNVQPRQVATVNQYRILTHSDSNSQLID